MLEEFQQKELFEFNFKKRQDIHKEIVAAARKSPESDGRGWSRDDGEYGSIFADDFFEEVKYKLKRKESLSEVETFLYFYIKSLLKKHETLNEPVVCVDIGGMNGISMLRISSLFADEIKDGSLEILVTSLGYVPNEDSMGLITADFEDTEQLNHSFNENLVRFVDLDIVELVELLRSENKKVHVVHERDALMHGYVNDRDFNELRTVLSRDALLLLKRLSEASFHQNSFTENPMARDRFSAHQQGLSYLKDSGFLEISMGSPSDYLMIAGSESVASEMLTYLRESV